MSTHRLLITVFLLMALVLPASAAAAQAQPPTLPPAPGGDWLPPLPNANADFAPAGLSSARTKADPASDAIQTPDGLWMMPAEASSVETPARKTLQPANSGGPDDFGYTFNSVPLDWIDASGGMETGISSLVDSAGPIDIGFPFKYYENTYGDLWVSRFGFLAFNNQYLVRSQSRIPEPSLPNDVIAPHWIPSYDSPDFVRYLRGGAAPNRWFVMEWNRQRSDCCEGDPAADEFTFQAILHENGDIVFQYQAMNISGSRYCESSGIEDFTGIDGLSITQFCNPVPGNQAVRITRPAPAARVRIFPQHYGAFIYPGEMSSTEIPIRNTGELGADTYDLSLNTSWAAALFHQDGVSPLTDTDGDGVIDSGSVAQAETKVVVLKVWSSAAGQAGDTNTALLTARSSLDTAKQRTATARITVPTSFVQVFRDDADGAMSLLLAKPQAQGVRTATAGYHYGSYMAVAELPNHNLIYAWTSGRCIGVACERYAYEIEYTILDPYGETVRPITRLVDHSGATLSTQDYAVAIAVAADGRIGLTWTRYLYSVNGQHNYNIFGAALNAGGVLVSGPINITNNAVWGTWDDLNVPRFYYPTIAVTGDNRFVMAWLREHQASAGYVDDIWYAVRNSTGGVVRNPTKLTNDTAGWERSYTYPSLARLTGNRSLLAFSAYAYPPGVRDIYFAVLASDGGVQKAATRLTDGAGWEYLPDAIQLANGRTVVAWTGEAPLNVGEQGWAAQYFNNETLSGTSVLTRNDPTIDFVWDLGSPGAAVSSDFFSARWQGTIIVPDGVYRFTMGSDDGSRLWIDDVLVMDYWDTCCQYWNRNVALSAGAHSVRMEMHEHDGAAWAHLSWQTDDNPVIKFAVLDSNYNRVAGPTALGNAAALTGNDYVSVTADSSNRAILTWIDYSSGNRRNLYYALVNTSGAVLAPPTIYRTSQASSPRIESSFYGNGNTTLTWTPPAGVDSVLSVGQPAAFSRPDSPVTPIALKLAGRGGLPATAVRLTAVLDPRLHYVNDTSGITPTVSGQTVTWNLPDLRLYDIRQFQLFLETSGAVLGDRLPVQLQLASAEPDLTPANNQATVQVWVSQPVYLPVMLR